MEAKKPVTQPTDSKGHCINIKCSLYKNDGDKEIKCDKMSPWLILSKTDQNADRVDSKLKNKLLENYAKLKTNQ
jgi:hypothetical protein